MRDTLFQIIINLLKTCSKFIGSDGTVRVYDWPNTSPAGYPFVVVGSESLESSVHDNTRDTRRFVFGIQIVGEKFGEQGGVTQAEALQSMRATEDQVLSVIDANYFLGRQDLVIRTLPIRSQYGATDGGTRVVLTITIAVDTAANITPN